MTDLLIEAGVNLHAFTITESGDFGIIRLLMDQPQKAHDVLKSHGFMASQTQVLALRIPDTPGALHRVAVALGRGGINIEYAYAGIADGGEVLLVLKLDQPEPGEAFLRDFAVGALGRGEAN